MQCRKKPTDFDLVKTTEPSIKAAVQIHDDYIAAAEEWIRAKQTSLILEKAVTAMEVKKRSIESLISLHGMSYFAGPSVPRDLAAAWLLQKEQSERRLNKRQRAKTRKRKKVKLRKRREK